MGKSEEIRVLITADAGKLNRELTAAEKAVLKAKGIIQSANGAVEGSSKSWAKYRNAAVTEMNKATEGVRRAQEKMRQIRAQITATTMPDSDLPPYIQAYKSMGRNDAQIQDMVAEMQRPSPELQQQYDAASAELDRYKKAAQEAGQSVEYLNQKVAESSQAETAQVEAAKSAAARAKEQAKATREAVTAHHGAGKAFNISNSGLWRFIRTAGMAVLGAATLYAGLRRLISALLETAKADSSLKTSLGQIKGSLQIAFQTVYQAALPALRALTSALATAAGYLAQFLSMLFGISWSSASQGAQDYAKSVGGAGAAAKAAAQNMMAIDELNVMQSEDSGGGGGAGGITPIYQELPMPAWMEKLVEWFRPIKEALEELWTGIKDFVEGVAERINTQALIDLRDAIVDVIDAFTGLFENKAVQALVAGVINLALILAATALSVVAKGIELIVALLNGDGRSAWAAFLGVFVEFGYSAKKILIDIGYNVWWVGQQISLAVATALGDIEGVKRITDSLAAGKAQYELEISMNEESKKQVDEYLNSLKKGAQTSQDATSAAKSGIAEYDEQLKGLKKSASDLSKTTTDQVTASTEAITKALADTPTSDAAKKLGTDLMQGFSDGVAESSSQVVSEMQNSINGGRAAIIAAAKQIATDAKAGVLIIVTDLCKGVYEAFRIMLQSIHYDLAYAIGGVTIDIALMAEGINDALASIKTQITIYVDTVYRSFGGSGGGTGGGETVNLARGGIIHAAAAGGGFTTGQLFVARETGPELVAGIGGGRTAVMNNNQIVESVSNGVYRAVVDAMSATQRGESGDTGDLVVNVDGRELLRIQRKAARSAGYQMSGNPLFAR